MSNVPKHPNKSFAVDAVDKRRQCRALDLRRHDISVTSNKCIGFGKCVKFEKPKKRRENENVTLIGALKQRLLVPVVFAKRKRPTRVELCQIIDLTKVQHQRRVGAVHVQQMIGHMSPLFV